MIDKNLRDDREKSSREVKLLLLGMNYVTGSFLMYEIGLIVISLWVLDIFTFSQQSLVYLTPNTPPPSVGLMQLWPIVSPLTELV